MTGVRLGWLALASVALNAQTRDPAETLVATRSRVLASLEKLPAISCTETINRSYFRRASHVTLPRSCDQIHVDFKKSRYKLDLTATDRLHLRVFIGSGSELLSWMDPLPFEWHAIEEVLADGPIGTGPLGAFLTDLFVGAGSTIEYIGAQDGSLVYRFREAEGDSHYRARAGVNWFTTGDGGRFFVDPVSLMLKRLVVETSTLPLETSMCEANVTVDYATTRAGADDVLLPVEAEWQNVLVNADETKSTVSYSSCTADRPPPAPAAHTASAYPPGLPISLALDDPIDLDKAAAGDIVSATVTTAVPARHAGQPAAAKGAKVRGRILNLEHRLAPEKYFLVAISFDVIDTTGGVSPVHMVLDRGAMLGPQVRKGSSRWPKLTLVVPDYRHEIPKGFKSRWVTEE